MNTEDQVEDLKFDPEQIANIWHKDRQSTQLGNSRIDITEVKNEGRDHSQYEVEIEMLSFEWS